MTDSVPADQSSRILPGFREQREDERFIRDWEEQAARFGKPPPLAAFDLARMRTPDWAHRFLISVNSEIAQHAFMVYGVKFAQLLGLSEEPLPFAAMMPQLPERYRPVFAKGCAEAVVGQAAVSLSGVFEGEREAYRVVFAAVGLAERDPMPAVFGAFNRRQRRPQFTR